ALELSEFSVEAIEFGVTVFEIFQLFSGPFAELDDLGHGRPVFAPEGLKEVKALFERLQAGGIAVEPRGVEGRGALEIAQQRDRLFVEGEQADRFGIDPFQILQRAAERAGLNGEEIGRASCRERVEWSVVAGVG